MKSIYHNLLRLFVVLLICQAYISETGFCQEMSAGQKSAGKPFTISLKLRQGHDDNVTTQPANQDGAWVTTIQPSIDYTFRADNTSFDARYTYGIDIYNERGDRSTDQRHLFLLGLNHQFNERYSVDISNDFSFAQEDLINDGPINRRLGSDRIRNSANIALNAVWTDRFSTRTFYENQILNYTESSVGDLQNFMAHRVGHDFQFTVSPNTTAVLNYTYENVDFETVPRGWESHFALVGLDHYLLPEWLVSGRAGIQTIERELAGSNDTVSPYVNLSTKWNYLERSYVEAAYSYGNTQTDNALFTSTDSHTAYGEIVHFITQKFSMGLRGTVQYALFDQDSTAATINPTFIGNAEEWTLIGSVNARYEITNWLSADASYRHSTVDSEFAGRNFWRNQVFFGLTGRY